MRLSTQKRQLRLAIAYALTNFSAPFVFYIAFHEWGAKSAILWAIFTTGLQILFHWVQKRKPTIFFILASVFITLFGGMDLIVATPRFFRLEPFAQNFIMASLLLISNLARIPVYSRMISDLPEKYRPKVPLPESYCHKVTRAWVVYLYLKSSVFLYLAFQVNLGSLIVLRSLIGGGTLLIMFIGELFFRKKQAPSLDKERINT